MEVSFKRAVMINAVSKYTTVIFGLVFNIVMARILSPEDYGVVVVITVFVTFFDMIANMGIGAAVIQNKELSNEDVDSIFSSTVRLSGLVGVAFMVLSIGLKYFYGNNAYVPIGFLLSISLIFNTLNMVPQALLMKEKKFLMVGIRTIVVNLLSWIVGIILALAGFKFYALILQSLAKSVAMFLWNYIPTRPRFLLKYNKESIDKIKQFSIFQFGFNVVNYFARNLDTILVGKFMGDVAVGCYDKAYSLMKYPIGALSDVITPTLHPILSDYQNDKEYIYKKYISIVKVLSLIGVFVTPFCYLAGREIVLILYGNKWLDVVPCFRFMALAIWVQMLLVTAGGIFQSVGDTKALFFTGCVTSLLTVCCIVEGLMEKSVVSISRNIAIAYNVQFLFSYYMLINKTLGLKLVNFIRKLLPDITILITMLIIGKAADYLVNTLYMEGNVFVQFGIKFISMFVIYLCMIVLTKQCKYFTIFLQKRKYGT